eukprot:NODE_789_length_3873_cov_0.228405.p5 type:complete len:126 gc:universal NODE_789_length_3873_cov_0.228405:1772-1395(-)
MTFSTAIWTPLRKSVGLQPAATFLSASLKIASANTVAVVVPSPAASFVLFATSWTSLAPRFSNLSSNTTALATVTPSLVILGDPNDCSINTFLPLGPKVTATARLNLRIPLDSLSLASVLNTISL